MREYLLGVVTTPLLAALGFGAFVGWIRLEMLLRDRWGITVEARREVNETPSDYDLSRDIWWERAFGPVIVGGWYREEPRWEQPNLAKINRWIGLGSRSGPQVMAFRSRTLGPVEAAGPGEGLS